LLKYQLPGCFFITDPYLLSIFSKEEPMKITKMIGLVLLVALVLGVFQPSLADEKGVPAPDPSQDQGWFCPWAGQYGMGPGLMWWNRGDWSGGPGSGLGGKMGPGLGLGYRNYNRSGKPITMDQAKLLVEHLLATIGNPNLKSGKITDKDNYFEAEIITKDDSLADKIMVDKQTGWMKSIY
jgi:hypothetical protein